MLFGFRPLTILTIIAIAWPGSALNSAELPHALATGTNGRLWWEQDHPGIRVRGDWRKTSRSPDFPYSVAGLTGTGAIESPGAGATVEFVVNIPRGGGELRIWAPRGPDQGILAVRIDGSLVPQFDQFVPAGEESHRDSKSYPLSEGDHSVRLKATGSKNPASSGTRVVFDAISVPMKGESDERRAMRLADSIAATINEDGSPRSAFDSSVINPDNDGGYSGMALVLAAAKWRKPAHREAVKRLIGWWSRTIGADGTFHWGYRAVPGGSAEPSVGPELTGLEKPITGVRNVDAIQSFPAVVLALYARAFPEDADFVSRHKAAAIAAIEALIRDNYDASNKLFYSSYQYKDGAWALFPAQYSAGQADVYLGMSAAHALTGDTRYRGFADAIRSAFDAAFWSPELALYSVSLTGERGGPKVRDDSTRYAFAQGWANWVFGARSLAHGENALRTMSAWVQKDGNSVLTPGDAEPITSNSSWLSMGLRSSRSNEGLRRALKQRLRESQIETYPEAAFGDGAVVFSDQVRHPYVANAAWAWLALTDQPGIMTGILAGALAEPQE